MTQAIQQQTGAQALEKVLISGDLAALSPDDRVLYYKKTCESLGLNPLTKPFEYIKLNGKLTLYARKDATDQLRKINGVSIEKPDIQQIDNLIIVTVAASDKNGRSDSDIGVVSKSDMNGNLANALMKAVTKAKRRVTLSICGLGVLDETEIETIPEASPAFKQLESPEQLAAVESLRQQLNELAQKLDWTSEKHSAALIKFDMFPTLEQKEDAVALVRAQVEQRERESKLAQIKDGLAAQGWDESELDRYLANFGIENGLDFASDEELERIFADMRESGMI